MAEPEIYEILRKIRYDLTAAQAKLTEAFNMLAQMNLPVRADGPPCPHCGVFTAGERALAYHLQNVHDGPVVSLNEAELAG